MRDGGFVLVALGTFLYVASCLTVAADSMAGAPANPAEIRSIATTETPGVARALGGFEHLAAFAAAASAAPPSRNP
jgi:hypothetical protein